MEVAAIAGVAGSAHKLWEYNRENYKYDRKMRMEQELKVWEYRNKQADLWRDDIKDIIGLTERRMDSYLIVNTLQLGMCVGLFTEGRLEPGTPPWLVHLYMLTLGAAFLYLLMSVWLALHAIVIAQCASVRLLTQYVRLPIPTWGHLEAVRTYGASFEQLGVHNMLRVPFLNKTRDPSELAASKPKEAAEGSSSSAGGATSSTSLAAAAGAEKFKAPSSSEQESVQAQLDAVDPWDKERHRDDIYELHRRPVNISHHVELARAAASRYQCYDAFARLSMTFGTNQLLHAVTYYCLGYCAVQDRASWPAWCIGTIMCSIASAVVEMDVILTRMDNAVCKILIVLGPICASISTYAWTMRLENSQQVVSTLLPVAYAAHGLWLFYAMRMCKAEKQVNDAVIPTKFRPMHYLDIFGWNLRSDRAALSMERSSSDEGDGYTQLSRMQRNEYWADRPMAASPLKTAGKTRASTGKRDSEASASEVVDRKAASSASSSSRSSPRSQERWRRAHHHTEFGVVPYLYDPATGDVKHLTMDSEYVRYREMSFASERSESRASDLPDEYSRPSPSGAHQAGAGRPAAASSSESMLMAGSAEDLAKRAAQWMQEETHPLQMYDDTIDDHLEGPEAAKAAACLGGFRRGATSPVPSREVTPRLAESPTLRAARSAADQAAYLHDFNATFPEVDGMGDLPDQERVKAGRIPWTVFRLATSLLMFLWLLGMTLPFGVFGGILEIEGLSTGPEEYGSDGPISRQEAMDEELERLHMASMPFLAGGEIIPTVWPSHAGFQPRSLSCDPAGRALVVTDDFGVYTAQLGLQSVRQLRGSGAAVQRQLVAAPNAAADTAAASTRDAQQQLALEAVFHRVLPCTALEGQTLNDVAVTCPNSDDVASCHVLVLHSHGKKLTECPLAAEMAALPASAGAGHLPKAQEEPTWLIAEGWLTRKSAGQPRSERVQSMAMNNDCLSKSGSDKEYSCVIVGTSTGRVVELRGRLTNKTSLVPARAIQMHPRAVLEGSLHVLQNGIVLSLRHQRGSIQALDAVSGTPLGEWRLPTNSGMAWRTVSGGGGNIYVVGHTTEHGKEAAPATLWRFSVPEELQRLPSIDERVSSWQQQMAVQTAAKEADDTIDHEI
eukprot:TRINITY_DN30439_c0_g2_i1.p1 TRINITY_DN30439_c0_g2~~TRINITY_DN30439_c0_g2_i1.p1  ORF type:complete len:1124 (-),score=219.66 TRINITY_DN30439_c0_g2_i1:96-3467(-)